LVILSVGAFLLSLLGCVILARWVPVARSSQEPQGPQRFHVHEAHRIGGLPITVAWVAMLVLGAHLAQPQVPITAERAMGLGLAATSFLAVGMWDDLTQRVRARLRLALTTAVAALAVVGMGLSVPRVGWPMFDALWAQTPMLGVGLAVLALAGTPHAFNLIDGYNGLAGTVAVGVLMALAHVALQLGDRELAAIALLLAAATGGFLVLNYPRGLIFAGDGGAYVWGFGVALVSVTLVHRHPLVSPWFPMLLVMYPVWETVFSIYRKWMRGTAPSVADSLHFHQLVYRRLVRGVFHDDEARRLLIRNSRTAPYLWGFFALSVIPALIFWRNSTVLAAFCLLFAMSYVAAYVMLVRFKVPKFLR
jgi:UDP-GlcNAc:undecaprenyl-phosphate/decaprenyl-phosphate GlcNAc-1-phosphate transferase